MIGGIDSPNGYRGPGRAARSLSGGVALAAIAAVLVALWLGLAVARPGGAPAATLALFDIAAPPAPPPEPATVPRAEPQGAAAPPAPRATPKPVTAPEPVVAMPVPVPAPPVAGDGAAASAGATDAEGDGSGAGGEGTGLGSGGAGDGTGSGVAVRARRIRGGINIRDFPRAEAMAQAARPLILYLSISPEGRVTDCSVARSSGHPRLDAITCRLAQRRFRYAPARDAAGRPVADVAGWRQTWWDAP